MNFLDGYIEAGKRIKSRQARHEFYGSIVDYFETGEIPEFKTEIAEACFYGIKFSLDKARAGRAGGKANGERNANETRSKRGTKREANGERNAKQTGNETRTKEEEDRSKERCTNVHPKKPHFAPPAPEQVRAYAEQYAATKGLSPGAFDTERFCDYYAANGWRVGKNPMRDWQATVRNWIARDCRKGDDDARFEQYA